MSYQMVLCNRAVRCVSPKWDASNRMINPSLGPFASHKCLVRYQKRAQHRRYSSLSTTLNSDLKSKFMQVYEILKSEILYDPMFEFDDHTRQYVNKLIDYNLTQGKMLRGLFVMESYELLKGEELTNDEVFLVGTIGWCLEWLEAVIVVHDDIMDGAYKRRGQPCWFRLPNVGLGGVNDAVVLRSHIPRIIKKHFKAKDYYVDILEHFNEGEFRLVSGQMMDMIITQVGEKDLSKYTMSLNRGIDQYKCGYSFYFPVACALIMLGENLDDYGIAKDVLIEMGIYFQAQDDYLDMYGDPEVVGKSGYDIQDLKCSWLVVKALELVNEEQKIILFENYGKKDATCVAKVKELYHTLNLQGVFKDYEKKTMEKLITSIQAHPNKAIHEVVKLLLGKIYQRKK